MKFYHLNLIYGLQLGKKTSLQSRPLLKLQEISIYSKIYQDDFVVF